MKRIAFIALIITCVASCKKETIGLLTQQVSSHTAYDLYKVTFVNDSIGYACGGDRWTKGVFIRTTNGGHSWSSEDSIYGQCAYDSWFFSAAEGMVVGNSSNTAYTNDSGATFTVTATDYKPINAITFIDRQHGVRVGGQGYTDGFISYTNDGGNNWTRSDLATAMNAVQYIDSSTAFASGYGVIYKSTDGGANFMPLDVRGDFFLSMDFPSPNVGYFAGYEGMILKTTDRGQSFKKVRDSNNAFSPRQYFRAIKFWDDNTGYVVGDAGIMYKTTNGGDSWVKVSSFTDANLHSIHLFSATSGIIVGSEGKVFLFQQ